MKTNACFFAALRRWAFPRRPVYLRKGAGQIARLALHRIVHCKWLTIGI